MLGLPEQVGRTQLAVDAVVGDHQRFGRPREQVDAHPAEQLALRFGDEGVPRPDEHVDGRDAGRPERHCAHRLNAAERIDLVGSGERLRGDDRGRKAPLERWRARDDARDAGDTRGDDRHVRRREQGIFPAGHVTAGRTDGNVAVSEDDAGQRFDLDVAHRLALQFGEAPDLCLREADIVEILLRKRIYAVRNLALAQPVIVARPAVEANRQVAHGGIAAPVDILEDRFDRFANLLVGRYPFAGFCRLLEPMGHVASFP